MRGRSIAISVSLVGLCACIDTSTVLESTEPGMDPAVLEAQARQEFASRPRSEVSAADAFSLMREAAAATGVDDPERIERLASAAEYAIWVAQYGADPENRSAHAEAAIVVCNTAVGEWPDRVEGYYYRAVATGLFAQENAVYGLDAMGQIRADGRRAVELDPAFDSGGPHRVLGGLYLYAPGPPSGVGSIRRAIVELEAAFRIAPDHPENMLFLATAYVEAERDPGMVTALIEQLPAAIEGTGDEADRELWRKQLGELRARLKG